jgi:hypothetical protein
MSFTERGNREEFALSVATMFFTENRTSKVPF